MVDIFDEVSEDLRADRARDLLKRYGLLLVAAAVLVVVGVGAWQAWTWNRQQQANRVAATFIDAMRQSGGTAVEGPTPAREQAATAFAGLAETAPEGYRTLARLREAALRAQSGDLPAALALWDKVSADNQADPLLRGVADLLWVQHQVDAGDPAAVEGRLLPLVAQASPWRPLALESQAWLALRTGQRARARDILKGLQADAAAPDGVRARASGLLTRLDDVPDPGKGAGG